MSNWNEPKFSLKEITIVFLIAAITAVIMTAIDLLLKSFGR